MERGVVGQRTASGSMTSEGWAVRGMGGTLAAEEKSDAAPHCLLGGPPCWQEGPLAR